MSNERLIEMGFKASETWGILEWRDKLTERRLRKSILSNNWYLQDELETIRLSGVSTEQDVVDILRLAFCDRIPDAQTN